MTGLEHIILLALAVQGIKAACATFHRPIGGRWAVLLYAVVFFAWSYETGTTDPPIKFVWFQGALYGLAGMGIHNAYSRLCDSLKAKT